MDSGELDLPEVPPTSLKNRMSRPLFQWSTRSPEVVENDRLEEDSEEVSFDASLLHTKRLMIVPILVVGLVRVKSVHRKAEDNLVEPAQATHEVSVLLARFLS